MKWELHGSLNLSGRQVVKVRFKVWPVFVSWYWTLAFLFWPQKNTELHGSGLKSKGKSVLIRAICGEDSLREPKTSLLPDSSW